MKSLTLEQLSAPVTDLRTMCTPALEQWHWLLPPSLELEPLLLTALGDLFLEAPDQSVLFLDTTDGTVTLIAKNRESWQRQLQDSERLSYWFQPGFVAALRASGYSLADGEVFSPTIPPILGGKQAPENYSPTHWLAHFHLLGQIHRQVKDLPSGTKISSIKVKSW
ncbi:MAG TPA: DUF1851 domain-containing protein [Thermoanaerobaculia bacterium]|nr:DUF1851 domain-containing protein [Thermoanaerobaculia bacterium]